MKTLLEAYQKAVLHARDKDTLFTLLEQFEDAIAAILTHLDARGSAHLVNKEVNNVTELSHSVTEAKKLLAKLPIEGLVLDFVSDEEMVSFAIELGHTRTLSRAR